MSTSLPVSPDDLAPVWRALADPHRRAILDLLRVRPRTTGDLASRFDLSRYGVMKHLEVLVGAGLVLVRRRGRERWNHINPVPIRHMYRRWIRPFEAAPADGLLRLKTAAERDAAGTRTRGDDMSSRESGVRALVIEQEIRIQAPVARVWQALTRETSSWWPVHYYVGQAPLGFRIEPRVGGRVYEDWGDGRGALFAVVTVWKEGEMLEWAGDMSASWGGPARTISTYSLEPDGNGTVLKFRDTPYGALSDRTATNLEKGWDVLLDKAFKAWVESGTHPERPESVKP